MQRKSLVLAILLIVSLVQGCYAPPPVTPPTQQNFQMQIRVDKSVYRIGEKIVITMQASRDCYLSLWDTSTQGEVTRIFPNQYASDNFLRGGVAYRIPDQADQFDFEITGPAGIERVRGVCTTENVNLDDARSPSAMEPFPKISQGRPGEFDQKVSEKLQVMPTNQWAEAIVTFQIVQ